MGDFIPPTKPQDAEATQGTTNSKEGNAAGTTDHKPCKQGKSRKEQTQPPRLTWEEPLTPGTYFGSIFDEAISSPDDQAATTMDVFEDWAEVLIDNENPELVHDESHSRLEWLRQKRDKGEQNVYLDALMSMVGHEAVKAHFLSVKSRVELAKHLGEDVSGLSLDLILHGHRGTGKPKIAQLYANFLYSIDAIPERKFSRNSSSVLSDTDKTARVIFFQDADKIDRAFRMEKILEGVGQMSKGVVLILSYRTLGEEPRKALQATRESRLRFPEPIELNDYDENELIRLLDRMLNKRQDLDFAQRDVSVQVLAGRLSRRVVRKDDDIINMNALVEELDKIFKRREIRLRKEMSEWMKTNCSKTWGDSEGLKAKIKIVILEDVLGPEPPNVRENSASWKELQAMVGLQSLKEEVERLFNFADANYQRERQGKSRTQITLNRCFLGNPGVGKTMAATLYSKILTEMGLLSKGQVTFKNPSDFLSKSIGESEVRTKKALEQAEGGVLIIDDAHMLYRTSGHGTDNSDKFRAGIIDTLVANISGRPGEDRCVLLCGYPDRMEDMFLHSNPGLQRRFPLENAINFGNFDDDQLCQILDQKMVQDGIMVSDAGRKVAREVLSRMKTRPQFGNGGDVENLLTRAKLRQFQRLKTGPEGNFYSKTQPLEAGDFDPDHDRSSRADANRQELFRGLVGVENLVQRFKGYQKMADGMRRHDIDPRPHIPWAFVFKGPPGTGKTTIAKKVGKLFYNMGFLSSEEIVTCSVTNLIGEHCGQTGPKVINQFELGLGKVLFIDEAYRLHEGRQSNSFKREAVGEIVDAMTKPRYMGNMVVILAGYGEDMEELLQSNQGLRSRFPTHIDFPHMSPDHCLQHLGNTISKLRIVLPAEVAEPGHQKQQIVQETFTQLTWTKNWANGRDVETVAKNIIGNVFMRAGESGIAPERTQLFVSFEELMQVLLAMLEERSRTNGLVNHRLQDLKGLI